ncbi:MAG: division/cell wall cluster transcriptional repressor MraZ [Candidatus Levybacteria bacterium RIFCSPHIGHO2_02_FULL_40_18]|nr:MAG: division/cell wall cluster transcriptional repressor MraZ [Candidatus Levybacteria bacterium RIFCSPHIGHO2_01_FULL_40_58]OGH27149.1 MAG: division/cell wall cluster transcriptional repressor MraZ [Candidatus Levybacteria bacterium RIFCSPHIGHO2_02_FULL_40_18]OGH31008.1 MAG: division/cell wall cluster transcriptional repressor MraZ [Candidatus Levybacteria bacterium RIFCSPHIGHO2_12_FULL_40_31]OGH41019.1 MAG: division/cell wall cluster transcriptional repressor MraZ [Candidatus Levybacteria b
MLIGQYEAKIDKKGRTAIPKKFREILGNNIIVTLGYESSLIVVSETQWQALLEGTAGRPFIEYETRETQRFLLGGAASVELDSKGRFVLPPYLREFAKVEDEIVFLGLSRYVEIWDKKRWGEYRGNLEKNIERISSRLVKKGEKNE